MYSIFIFNSLFDFQSRLIKQKMSFLLLGFFTGLSLILAIGAQNIFVIEQGLKKQYVFLVCLICSISDLLLIFLGIFYLNTLEIFLLIT